ncbi:MAG: transporter [Hyphomicrobiales bacterium]|nr:transporter [Hyphomicrobiales bacterium]
MDALQDKLAQGAQRGAIVRTDIPARLDRLPWGRFHTLVVVALGVTWILDGLEVTIAGSIAAALKEDPRMAFTESDIGLASSLYLLGAVIGALFFGWLTDRLGRKKLFFITLALYTLATGLTAFSWDLWSFCVLRFLTGAGIGGEYAAINSTIQELIPARYRGWSDLTINGSFWIGAAMGAGASIVLLDPAYFSIDVGWRLAFFIGALLSLIILFMRFWLPESPRWLVTHGREADGRRIIEEIEAGFGARAPHYETSTVALRARSHTPLREVFHALFVLHRTRAMVGLVMMASQAFFYNAIFFTYALVLTRFYAVPTKDIGWYILPFALGNFMGPLLLGRLFDTIGRRPMIIFTYAISGVLLAISGWMFARDMLTAPQLTMFWTVIFFFASAAASSAYLTVSETFPLEVRALAIAVFYAIGTGLGGVAAPYVFGRLVETGSREAVFAGYLFGSALMLAAAVFVYFFAVAAERKSLEEVARPLSAAE